MTERICPMCLKPTTELQAEPGGAMACPSCVAIVKEVNLFGWRRRQQGASEDEIDAELLEVVEGLEAENGTGGND